MSIDKFHLDEIGSFLQEVVSRNPVLASRILSEILLSKDDVSAYEYTVGSDKWIVLDSNTFKFTVNATTHEYRCYFSKTTGLNVRFGKTVNDDPKWCALGPEIMDLEISVNGCVPVKGSTVCTYCCPPDTKITQPDGKLKNIQDIAVGDSVLSLQIKKNGRFVENRVENVYERNYDGDLIVFELEDGKILNVTPNHPFVLRDGREVKAEDITPDMDIVVEDEFKN